MPSNDPRKKATKKKVSSVAEWRKKTAQVELPLPSGEVCLVKRPGLPQLLAANVLPDLLTPIAQEAILQGERGNVKQADIDAHAKINDILQEKDGLNSLLGSFAQVTAFCVIDPPTRYHRRVKAAGQLDQIQQSYVQEWEDIPTEDRDPDFLYTDEVALEDQMFIFQFVVGGSADLVEFRKQLGEPVDGVADAQADEEATV